MNGAWRSPWSFRSVLARAQQEWRAFVAVYALVMALFVGLGIWVYAQDLAGILRQQYAHLGGVGADQVKELVIWQQERADQARRFSRGSRLGSRLARSAGRYLDEGVTDENWALLTDEMHLLLTRDPFEAVFLLDRRGRVRYEAGPVRFRDRLARDGPAARAGTLFLAYGEGAECRVVVLEPVVDARGRTVGAIGFQLLPQRDFGRHMSAGIPFGANIAGITIGQATAEVVLVEGGRVIAPDPARRPRSVLTDRRPLQGAFFTARDEAGRKVVAEELPVPNTRWSVVTRVEARGFNAQPVVLTFWATLLLLVFIATTGGLTWLVWKWVDARRLLAESQAQRELALLEQRFDYLTKYANDAIVLTDEAHRLVEANDRAVELYGYTREELRQMDVAQLRTPETLPDFARDWAEVHTRPSIVYETVHRARDGRTFPVEVSAREIRIEGRRQVQAIIRDISGRKRAEAQLQRQANVYEALGRVSEACGRHASEAQLLAESCRIVAEVGGFAEVYVAMAEDGGARITTRCGAPETEGGLAAVGDPPPEPMLGAFRAGRAEHVNDYGSDRRTASQLGAAGRGIASAAAFPLRRFGQVVGVLGVAAREPGIFDEPMLRPLRDLALDLSLGLEAIEREQRRRTAERMMRDSELRYRSLFENMGDGVLVLVRGEAGGFLVKEANTALERSEGVRRREVVGRDVKEAFPWAAHCLLPAAEEVWRGGEARVIEAHRHVGQRNGWHDSYVYRVATDEIVAVIGDVTARHEAMEALRRSEERLALVLEGSDHAYWDFNFETGEVYYSRRFAELFGYTVEELGAGFDSWQKLVHPTDLVEVQRQLADHLTGKTAQFASEHRMRHKERGYLWVRARGRVVWRGPEGQPLRMAGTHMDITAERARERRLREWAVVFEQSREAILITDSQRRIVSVNHAFTEITGYAPEEVLGRDPHMLSSGVHDRAFFQTLWTAIERTGHWQGELQDRRKDGAIIPLWFAITAAKDGAGRVQNYVAIASDISGRKETEERIRQLAYQDALTRLPNRTLFSDRLAFAVAHAQRHGYVIAVLFLDLDHFKAVNDRLGYPAGDALLVQAAERLRAGLRRDDTVARQGGDEFLVLFAELGQPEDAVFGARKMLEDMARPYRLDGAGAAVTASIGIALYPQDGEDADTLLRHADAALYHAKERGRNNFQFYGGDLNDRIGGRLNLESQLRRALAAGEFVLHYQPRVAVDGGALLGAEALLRWRRDGVLAKPAEFLPAIDASGLALDLGEWVLREACRQQGAWRAAGLPQVPIAVNVSDGEARQSEWLERVRAVLGECAGAEHLELEFSEQALRQHAAGGPGLVQALARLGVEAVLDNFGGDDANLDLLRRLPIRRLKLDRSLMRELVAGGSRGSVAEAVVWLARSLGMRVVAQGVEEAGDLQPLRRQRCDEMQGRFVAPPLDGMEFERWWKAGGYEGETLPGEEPP